MSATVTPADIHAWLDGAGVPFRLHMARLGARFGTYSEVWNPQDRHSRIADCGELLGLPDLHVIATRRPTDDPDRPPRTLEVRMRGLGAIDNLSRLVSGVAQTFGPGRDASVSNTHAVRWGGDWARIACTVWPRHLNRWGRNTRHELDPGAVEEAVLSIRPDWWPPLTDAEASALDTYVPDHPAPRFVADFDRLSQPAPSGMMPGLGVGSGGTYLVAVSRELRVALVPRAAVTRARWDRLTPAKGGGSSSVWLATAFGGTLTLADGRHDDPTHEALADWLAAWWGGEVPRSVAPDC